MITINDIAKITGFSKSTVSKALNNHFYVSSETKKKVLLVAQKYNYIPNSQAIRLSTGKNFNIGVIVPYSTYNSYYTILVNSIIHESFMNNYHITFFPTNYNKKIEITYLKMLASKAVDGLIILSATNTYDIIENYIKYGPIISCENTKGTKVPSVTIIREKIYKEILEKLKKHSISHIGISFSRTATGSEAARKVFSTFKETLSSFSKDNIYEYVQNYYDGYKAAKYFYSNKIQCIFANSDEIAAGIINFYDKKKLKPVIIGQDNQAISKFLNISTIDFQLELIGKKLVQQCINNSKEKIILKGKFIKRNNYWNI